MKSELKSINKYGGILVGLLSILLGFLVVYGVIHGKGIEFSIENQIIILLLGWIIALKGLTISKVIK